MAFQYSDTVLNAALNAIETTIGTAPSLVLFTGSKPTNTTDLDSGTSLVTITLPSDWLADASGGSKGIAGTWTGTANADGTAGHFRIKNSGTTYIQGTVDESGADLNLDNTDIANGQTITVTSFDITASGS